MVANRSEPLVTALTDLQPLNARSLALSVLLGTHPPELPVAALVLIGELFDINPGAMRTALSRLTTDGTLVSTQGRYRLVGTLLERQQAQDIGQAHHIGRHHFDHDWNGEWHTVLTLPARRPQRERRVFRASMTNQRLGELRPDIWMRPANTPAPVRQRNLLITTGSVATESEHTLVAKLWDLKSIGTAIDTLLARCQRLIVELDWAHDDAIVSAFTTAAATVRLLRLEPLLPSQLQPQGWNADALRATYRTLDQLHREALGRFFADAR